LLVPQVSDFIPICNGTPRYLFCGLHFFNSGIKKWAAFWAALDTGYGLQITAGTLPGCQVFSVLFKIILFVLQQIAGALVIGNGFLA
jgi:hypothetical protein